MLAASSAADQPIISPLRLKKDDRIRGWWFEPGGAGEWYVPAVEETHDEFLEPIRSANDPSEDDWALLSWFLMQPVFSCRSATVESALRGRTAVKGG
jgi:hypothetical protein